MLLILWEASSLATACTGSWRAPSHSGKSSCGRAQVSSAHAASRASALPHRRHALRFCSNSCGLMSRFFAGAASARDAFACVGSELARDALRICSNRCGHGHRFLWERPWPRCPSPGAATGQAWRASASARARHVFMLRPRQQCFACRPLHRRRPIARRHVRGCPAAGAGTRVGSGSGLSAGGASTRTAAARPAPAPHPRAGLRHRHRSPHSC